MKRHEFIRLLSRVGCTAVAALLLSGPLAASDIPLPRGWSLVPAGDQIQTRGLVMRLSAGMVDGSVGSNTAALRRVWGEPVQVRNDASGVWVSKVFDRYFATVQLSPLPGGKSTRVLFSKADMRDARSTAVPPAWTTMPSGSTLMTDMTSSDRGIAARHVSYANSSSVSANRDHLVQWLAADGHLLQSETETPPTEPEGRLLMFSNSELETTAVIGQSGGVSTVTLNQRQRGARLP